MYLHIYEKWNSRRETISPLKHCACALKYFCFVEKRLLCCLKKRKEKYTSWSDNDSHTHVFTHKEKKNMLGEDIMAEIIYYSLTSPAFLPACLPVSLFPFPPFLSLSPQCLCVCVCVCVCVFVLYVFTHTHTHTHTLRESTSLNRR